MTPRSASKAVLSRMHEQLRAETDPKRRAALEADLKVAEGLHHNTFPSPSPSSSADAANWRDGGSAPVPLSAIHEAPHNPRVLGTLPLPEVPENGACECDAPATAHEVRQLAGCCYCGHLGKLVAVPDFDQHTRAPPSKMHVFCAMKTQPAEAIAPAVLKRARLCCLMKYADGDAEKAGQTFTILQALRGKAHE